MDPVTRYALIDALSRDAESGTDLQVIGLPLYIQLTRKTSSKPQKKTENKRSRERSRLSCARVSSTRDTKLDHGWPPVFVFCPPARCPCGHRYEHRQMDGL